MARTAHYRSQALSRSKVADAIAAYRHAEATGSPLNTTIDIHWDWTRFANSHRRRSLAKLLESQRHWLAHRDIAFYAIAVRENPPPHHGEHCHQLCHVPATLQAAFIQHTRDFLRGDRRHQARALKWETVWSIGKLAYMLKGCTAAAGELLLGTCAADHQRNALATSLKEKGQQGTINGKRLLISEALGPAARNGAASASNSNTPSKPSTEGHAQQATG